MRRNIDLGCYGALGAPLREVVAVPLLWRVLSGTCVRRREACGVACQTLWTRVRVASGGVE